MLFKRLTEMFQPNWEKYREQAQLALENKKMQDAKMLFEKGIEIAEKQNIQNEIFAEFRRTYAWVLRAFGKQSQAISELEKAIELMKSIKGKLDPTLLIFLTNLGVICIEEKQYAKAEEYAHWNMRIVEQNYSHKSEEYTTHLRGLAVTYLTQNKFDQAEETFKRLLDICRESFGDEHYETAITQYNLSNLYDRKGQFDLAVELCEKALPVLEKENKNLWVPLKITIFP